MVAYLARLAFFTVAYVGTALISLQIQGIHDGITPIWPPSGIALFAFYRYGLRMWPVVAVGIAMLGWHVGIPPLTAVIAALGNIGEATLGCMLIRRFDIHVGQLFQDVVKFLFLPVLLAPVLGATVGTFGMILGGAGSWEQLPLMWLMWWIGDAVGILLFTPLLMGWWQRPKKWSSDSRLLEWLVVIAATLLIGWHTFHRPESIELHDHGNLQVLVMPFVLWAAIRLGLRGVTLVSLIVCGWVLWGAANTTGPFHIDNKVAMGLYESSFILVVTLTGLIVQSLFRELSLNMHRLRNAHDELEDRVKQRTADLEQTNLRLQQEIEAKELTEQALHQSEQGLKQAKQNAEQANDSKTRFLAAASHDLRQPLQAIIAHTGLLSARNTNPELAEPIDQMDKASSAMRELLEKLLGVSEIDAGRLITNLSVFPIDNLLGDLQGQFQQTAGEKGLRLVRVRCSALVQSDPGLIRVILQNLISNAIKYTDEGKVLIGCRRRGDVLRICVCDTGIGIGREGQQVIFEEFIQLENPARDRKLGTGLGLATVQRMADLLNHPLYVQSVTGKGSCFAIDVPLSKTREQASNSEPDNASTQESATAVDVLLIDDDEIVLHANTLMLETQGYRVKAVADPVGAFDVLAAAAYPDIIISDYRLPGSFSGAELITELRNRAFRLIPAIILTGDITLRDDENLPESCVLVQKPVSPAELKRVITRLLEGSG
jgi:signal transduction histidine kinase